MLHYLHQSSVDENATLGVDLRSQIVGFLSIFWYDNASNLLRFVLEIMIIDQLITLGLNFDSIISFDQNSIFK